ncbi:hypothetical protein JVX98_13355 [Ensifer sp. PDNC004]|uniref:hypothetical protein n=1 Tax=Ensifer sp. PDNC004 TaxID=2811423 RepID=UPI001962C762|nr:hypothetical protein [Ensifer sp. PDNC004]QRY69202.1 hypothetical protein JVX98_13355 [Ensifer sp. PDNC004]
MSKDAAITHTSAVGITTAALVASLVSTLRRKGVLTERDEIELYEFALLLIEQQGDDAFGVSKMARELIEQHLKPKG